MRVAYTRVYTLQGSYEGDIYTVITPQGGYEGGIYLIIHLSGRL